MIMENEIIQGIEYLKSNDKVMREIILEVGECYLNPSPTYCKNLIRSVVSQQLSVSAARTIWSRFENLLGSNGTPQFISNLNPEEIRKCGISNQKVTYVKEISKFFEVNPNINFDKMSDDEVVQTLTSIKGVGTWTAQMFLIFSLCRLNVLPLADTGLQRSFRKNYLKDKKKQGTDLKKVSKRWGNYCTISCWYLWKSLDI